MLHLHTFFLALHKNFQSCTSNWKALTRGRTPTSLEKFSSCDREL